MKITIFAFLFLLVLSPMAMADEFDEVSFWSSSSSSTDTSVGDFFSGIGDFFSGLFSSEEETPKPDLVDQALSDAESANTKASAALVKAADAEAKASAAFKAATQARAAARKAGAERSEISILATGQGGGSRSSKTGGRGRVQ